MTRRHIVALLVFVILLTGIGLSLLWRKPGTAPVSPGQALYQKNCVVCHGTEGRGDGQAAYLLNPKPRNFRAGKFRLVTSQNLQPVRNDIMRTLSNGMPGTGMPGWGQLPESDRGLLADYVLKLDYDGYVEQYLKAGKTKREAEEYAKEMSTPDQPIPIPPEPPLTPAGLEQGRQFFMTNCSKCHGQNGEGRNDPTWRTSEGFPTSSRNLKEGVFKGGRDAQALYLRFGTGLPGTPMPNLNVPSDTVWRIVQYVQSLSDPRIQERATIRSKELIAQKVARLPSSPDDQLWKSAPEVSVPLMPLWWVNGYISEVMVKTVHDGRRIAFLLRWKDATQDVEGVRQRGFSDASAIQFSASSDPPLFAMGSAGKEVSFWHWKAMWDLDRTGVHELAQAYPNLTADAYYGAQKGWKSGPLDDTTFLPARYLNNPVAISRQTSIEVAKAAGMGTYTAPTPTVQNVQGASTWKDGIWQVSLIRDLAPTNGDTLSFLPGEKVSVAFAIWNGSAAERNGQKTVSIWNTLVLAK
ncbi:MAG: ethylbenzene dehydrogenase-related protein [Terriglobia bacterium]